MILLLAACAPVSDDQARTAWLRDVLTRDNAVWTGRDPALLEGKYRRMAADRFDFLRGTASLFYADVSQPDPERTPTRFATDPDVAAVLLAGDPHPENVGTMTPGGGELRFEVTDLDGAVFGAYVLDARRGALGVATLAEGVAGCDDACREDLVAAYATAYATSLSTGEAGGLVCGELEPAAAVEALCATAREEELLAKVSADAGDGRRFSFDAAVDEAGKGILPLSDEEDAQVDTLLAGWTRRPAGFRVLDRARRYGVGVASFPAVRYGVLWDLGDDGPDDDALLGLREVVDPPGPPGRSPTVPVLFDSNAARIEEVAWLLWSRPDADPLMAGLADGGVTFKLTSWADGFQGFDHVELAEATPEELAGVVAVLGQVLAGSHARGVRADGEPAAAWLAADVAGREELFVEERVRDAAIDLARADADHALFVAALDAYGPTLGADTLPDETTR